MCKEESMIIVRRRIGSFCAKKGGAQEKCSACTEGWRCCLDQPYAAIKQKAKLRIGQLQLLDGDDAADPTIGSTLAHCVCGKLVNSVLKVARELYMNDSNRCVGVARRGFTRKSRNIGPPASILILTNDVSSCRDCPPYMVMPQQGNDISVVALPVASSTACRNNDATIISTILETLKDGGCDSIARAS